MKIKKIFLIFFIFISLFSFLKTTLAQTDNTKGVYNYNYVSSFDGSQQSPVTIKEDKDATGLGSTLNYILTFLAVAIIVFIIFRLLQGAFLKGTYDNIYDQTSGNKSIKVAGTALVVFILAYAVLSFINPQLTGWSVATNFVSNLTAGGSGGGGGADSSYSNNMCRVDPTYNAKSIKEQLKDDEQFAACPYYDVDAYSIGYGYHLNSGNNKKEMENAGIDDDTINNILNYKGNKGCPAGAPRITEAQADKLLDIKLDLAKKSAATWAGSSFNSAPENIQKVLINMSYNMGSMTDFKQTGDTYQGFIKNDLTQMAKGIQTAKYCRDVQGRCYRIVGLLLGSCPEVQSSGSLAQNPSLNYIINDNGKTQCPINTTDLGAIKSGYKGNPIVRLCRLSSIKGAGEDAKGNKNNLGAVVNAVVAEKFQTLGEKANLGGFPLSANSSFRLENSCGGKGDGDYCANPGTSPHQLGIAVDLAGTGGIKGNTFTCSKKAVGTTKLWSWLTQNAPSIGIKQYSGESWHWDLMPMGNRCG